MGGQTPPKPKEPRVVRMPNEEDPELQAAAQRKKAAALQRQGRLSTILTDQNQGRAGAGGDRTIGSSGKSLGN